MFQFNILIKTYNSNYLPQVEIRTISSEPANTCSVLDQVSWMFLPSSTSKYRNHDIAIYELQMDP